MKRALQLLVMLIIGGLALHFALKDVRWAEFAAALRSVDGRWFLLGVTCFAGTHVARSIRWGRLIHAVRPGVPFRSYFSICSVGFMLINILPFRLGEFARPYLLLEREDVPFGSGMATVVVERVLDVLALGALFVGVLLFADFSLGAVVVDGTAYDIAVLARTGILGVLVPVGGAVVALLLMGDRGIEVARRVAGLLGEVPARLVARFLATFLLALRGIGTWRRALPVAGWTVVLWVLNVVSIDYTIRAFEFGSFSGFWVGGTVVAVICVALILPAPPGFAGVFELACAIGLAIFGVGASGAAAFAVLLHSTQFLLVTSLGLFFVALDRMSIRRLLDLRNEIVRAGAAPEVP